MNAFDIPTYSTIDVAEASRVSPNVLAGQLSRDEIHGLADSGKHRAPGQGRGRLFSMRRAMHIALTEALVQQSLPARLASKLALQFSDIGGEDEDCGIDNEDSQTRDHKPSREAGQLFPTGQTVFRVLFREGHDPVGEVVQWETIKDSPLFLLNIQHDSMVLVDLGSLYWRVRNALA